MSRFEFPLRRTYLGKSLYLTIVAATALLALAQMLLLPRLLDPMQFGVLALALSVTQGIQQFGDLGFGNAAARSHLDSSIRGEFREYSLTLTSLVTAGGMIVFVALSVTGALDVSAGIVFVLALLAGGSLAASKMRASAYMQAGDERHASFENMVWQNAPKVGMVLGAFVGSALAASAGAAISALLAGRPALPRKFPTFATLRATMKYWGPGLALVSSAFAVSWVDTYVLAFTLGVTAAGDYQAIVRPLVGITYLYLPIISLIQSSSNHGDTSRVRKLSMLAIAVSLGGAAAVAVFLCVFGSLVWPEYSFPPIVVIFAALAAVAACCSSIFGIELLVHGRQFYSALSTFIGLIVLLAVTLPLVLGGLGLLGAAIGSLAGWGVAATMQFFGRFADRPHSSP